MRVTASTDTVVTTGSSAVVVNEADTIAASSITAPKARGVRGVAAPMPARARAHRQQGAAAAGYVGPGGAVCPPGSGAPARSGTMRP